MAIHVGKSMHCLPACTCTLYECTSRGVIVHVLYRILLRVRQLHVLRWSMLVDQYDQIMAGDTIK